MFEKEGHVLGRVEDADAGGPEDVGDRRRVSWKSVSVSEEDLVFLDDESSTEDLDSFRNFSKLEVFRNGRQVVDVSEISPPRRGRQVRSFEFDVCGSEIAEFFPKSCRSISLKVLVGVDEEPVSRNERIEVEELVHLGDRAFGRRHRDEDESYAVTLECVQIGWRTPRVDVVPTVRSSEMAQKNDHALALVSDHVQQLLRLASTVQHFHLAQSLRRHQLSVDLDRAVLARFAVLAKRRPAVAHAALFLFFRRAHSGHDPLSCSRR